MKALIAKFLIAVYLFSFTPLKELNRIPLLFIHYAQHLDEDNSMTISAFLEMHYLHGLVMDEDFDQDMQLPFKNAQDFSMLPTFIFNQIDYIDFDLILVDYIFVNKIKLSHDLLLQNPEKSGIFHPPQYS